MRDKIHGMMTAAGTGSRLWPLSLLSMDSLLSKGMVRLAGIPLAEIQLYQFMQAHIRDVQVVARFIDNRHQLSDRLNSGADNTYGTRLTFSHPLDDAVNTGSGDAVLRQLESQRLEGITVCLANDNLYRYPIRKTIAAFRQSGAVLTMMTVPIKDARAAINTYGLVVPSADGMHVERLSEKPKSESELAGALGCTIDDIVNQTVQINSAAYLLDNVRMREIAKEPWVVEARRSGFDMAGDLINGLLREGYPVGYLPLEDWSDLGNPSALIDTSIDVVGGRYGVIFDMLGQSGYVQLKDNVWIHPETMRTPVNGTTLTQKIRQGKVHIGPNVYIGRDVRIEEGAMICDSSVDKWCFIGEGSLIEGSYLSPSTFVWSGAVIEKSATAMDVRIRSSQTNPTYISGYSCIGPKVEVPEGTALEGVTVWPGFTFPEPGGIYSGKHLEPDAEARMRGLNRYSRAAR
jgi:NDP-sugar pyrophosphorylase family protein